MLKTSLYIIVMTTLLVSCAHTEPVRYSVHKKTSKGVTFQDKNYDKIGLKILSIGLAQTIKEQTDE